MVRISGMLFGLGLLIAISSWTSPAGAWDSDDDDDDYRRPRQRCVTPVVRPPYTPVYQPAYYPEHRPIYRPNPVFVPRRSVEHYHSGNVAIPPAPQFDRNGPIFPPVPPSELEHEFHAPRIEEPVLPPPIAPPVVQVPHEHPGQFVDAAVPLYPYVRVKDRENIPRYAVPRILAVRSPDPFRFPGCVFVKVCVPPGPCRGLKVESGGSKIELKYHDFEVEVTSNRGVITVEYDD